MIVIAVAGFAPSIIDSSRRLAPLTPLVAAHGSLVLCWLLLFVFQAMLIGSRHVAFHRRMGIVALVLLTVLVPLSYVVTVQMVHRGFDLSGDQGGKTDPLFGSIFNFATLIEFLVLGGIALACRRRKEIHKRFMLFANISLMGAGPAENRRDPHARVAGFKSEWWPDSFRNGGRLQIGIPAGFMSEHPAGLNRNPHPLRISSAISACCRLLRGLLWSSAGWHCFSCLRSPGITSV
jgi:hypothetical protein